MNIYSELIAVCWAIFLIVWSTGPLSIKGFLYRFGAIALILLLLRLSSMGVSPVFGIVGVTLSALGVSFAIWARFYLGKNWGAPMTLRERHELVITGPYHFVRHPIYTGVLVALLGAVVTQGIFWLIPFVYFVVYFMRSARLEERRLLEHFPNIYPVYMSRTKMLIPFIF